MTLNTLIAKAESIANNKADGHLTILKFTTGWKVFLGTPNLDIGEERERISSMKSFESLELALIDFTGVETQPKKNPIPVIIGKMDTPLSRHQELMNKKR